MFGLLQKIITTITAAKIVLWTLTLALVILGYTLYENRKELFKHTAALVEARAKSARPIGEIFSVSERTEEKLQRLVDSNENFIAVDISAADLRLNQRNSVYFYSRVQNAQAEATVTGIEQLPLFSTDDEANRQMIKLINGEFFCIPYRTTAYSRFNPIVNQNVAYICRSSLPPYYGSFSGFMTLYLRHVPDTDEQLRIKVLLETFSTEVYFKDVVPTGTGFR